MSDDVVFSEVVVSKEHTLETCLIQEINRHWAPVARPLIKDQKT